MAFVKIPAHAWELGIDWRSIVLLSFVHLAGIGGVFYLCVAFNWYTVCLAVGVFFLCHIAIRVGAHSLYTHRAYKAALLWHVFLIIFFAATMQGPLTVWVMLHVRHHQYTDTQKDPYSPVHGWLWAHMLWGCFKLPSMSAHEAVWLFKGKTPAEKLVVRLVKWQGDYMLPAGMVLGVLVPGLVAVAWGDFWGGIFVAGFLRLMCQYHFTWQINSVSHIIGPQPFLTTNSSRNSPRWFLGILSLLSVGEASQHNRHHKYARDFRIGAGYSTVDPGKWVLYGAWGFSQLLRMLRLSPLVWDLYLFDTDGSVLVLH